MSVRIISCSSSYVTLSISSIVDACEISGELYRFLKSFKMRLSIAPLSHGVILDETSAEGRLQ